MTLKTAALWLATSLLTVAWAGELPAPTDTPSLDPTDAVAQDDGEDDEDVDDALDDILNESDEESAEEERRAVRTGDIDDRVGVSSEELLPEETRARNKRLIKVLQKKTFMKIGRYEASPHVGFVTNDPFINRYLVGASFSYHLTEILGLELWGSFSPDFGKGDWKTITHQLVSENKVTPDISKMIWFMNASMQFSPMYGKVAVLGRRIIMFDIFGVFGTGIVHTADDLEALQAENDPLAVATQSQNHITTDIGGGFRVTVSPTVAFRLEGRSMIYIETIRSTTLEMKNNFFLSGSVSIFFPGME